MVTDSSILAWRIPRTEEPGQLQSMGLQRAGHDWVTERAHTHTHTHTHTWSVLLPRKSENDSGQWSEGLTVQPSSLPSTSNPIKGLGLPSHSWPLLFHLCFFQGLHSSTLSPPKQSAGGWVDCGFLWLGVRPGSGRHLELTEPGNLGYVTTLSLTLQRSPGPCSPD